MLRERRVSHSPGDSDLARGARRSPAQPPHSVEIHGVPSQPANRQQQDAILRGIHVCSRQARRITRLHHILGLSHRGAASLRRPRPVAQVITPATIGSPRPDPQRCHFHLQRAIDSPRRRRRVFRSYSGSLGRSRRGSPHLRQWVSDFFALPLSVVSSQLNASSTEGMQVGVPPRDSSRAPMENPPFQGPP